MPDRKKIQTVLVVDDEAVVRNGIRRALEGRGMASVLAATGEEGLSLLEHQAFDLVLLDIRMPDLDGVTVLRHIRSRHPGTPVIMITGYPTIDTAVECTKLGGRGLPGQALSPQRPGGLPEQAGRASGNRTQRPVRPQSAAFGSTTPGDRIIGESPEMQSLFDKILKVAPTDSTVLITGESGTGKELVARAIHAHSQRKDREFVAVDCSSLVETLLESELFGHVKGSFTGALQTKHGLFELANKGTFFFDEISNLSLNIQAKLLRVFQEREFMKVGDQRKITLDIRILSASTGTSTSPSRPAPSGRTSTIA